MPTNITLTLDTQIVEQAEAYARATGHSLAEIVENALRATIQLASEPRVFSPQVQELFSSLKLSDDFNYKESLTEALRERYGV